ncbi:MAG TPA: alkaline phosphatase [Fimbriimonas sp.]|nr:alkaline phosphatase [Fimbriimonas sp.]
MSFSRRSILALGASSLASGCFANLDQTPGAPFKWKGRRPKNIIFCVADGMAHQTVSITDDYSRVVLGRNSYLAQLMDQPDVFSGLQATRSLSSIVTDSAAAAATWGSGRRVWNGMLNMYPDKTSLRTLNNIMVEAGVKTGLVTTTTMTHATPSGFSINMFSRDDEHLIAEQHLTAGVSVLFGGGDRFFSSAKRKDKRDLYADFEKKGYKVVKTRDDLMAMSGDKMLGIFSDSHLPFSVDRDNSPELQKSVPTLAEMASKAIGLLKGNSKGFVLQIEGGKVDHAGHANDLAGHIYDQIAFEEAVKVAIDFAREDKNTLVIVTADHATGGPSLNGAGNEYFDSTRGIASLAGHKSTYSPILAKIGLKPTPDKVKEVVDAMLGVGLKPAEAQILADAIGGKSPFAALDFHKGIPSAMGLVMANYTKVGWTSLNHTSEHVLVTAYGPGSEQVRGLTQNYEFFNLMLAAKGLKHENPIMSFEDAQKAMAKHEANKGKDALAYVTPHDDCDDVLFG